MLSNCRECKYHHPDLCAVNPTYRLIHDKLRSKLTEADIDACEVGILPCNDWEPSEELQPLTLELTLSRREWKQILTATHSLPRELFAQIQTAIAHPGEIIMIPVESSNIAGIGYSNVERVLRVDFLSGTRYRYEDVDSQIFDDFLAAPSKGRFFNSEIKREFDYVRIDEGLR